MSLRRAKTADEYTEWVKQAMFEVEDLKDCLLYEQEELHSFPTLLESLESGVRQVYEDMCAGRYRFGRQDLPFMEIAPDNAGAIPFHTLLRQINETHRRGLEVDDETP